MDLNKLIFSITVFVFSLGVSSTLMAQDSQSTELKDFKLVIEKTEDGIKLQCKKGAAWKELSYRTCDFKEQAIDEFGMTSVNKKTLKSDSKLADFLITIKQTDRGISLKGIKGTAWTDLSFSLSDKGTQSIDQNGMTLLN